MSDSIAIIGLQGVQRGLESAARHATEVSEAFTSDSDKDYVGAAVGLSQDRLQVSASAKVIQVASSLSGTILDILA